MTAIKERILGALDLMSDKEAENIWLLIQDNYTIKKKSWEDIEEVEPDKIDLAMIQEAESNPECREFVSNEEAMKGLGLNG